MSDIWKQYVFDFYSDADHIGRLAGVANRHETPSDALEELRGIKARYGDMFRLGMRLDDAITMRLDDAITELEKATAAEAMRGRTT